MTLDWYGEGGPAVVLLHGIPGWRGTFAEVGERLGRECRAFVPDLLGFGESDDPPDGAHAAEQAAAVNELIDALGLEHVHLVGFDFGGPTAVLVAGQRPGRVLSMTLAATNLFPDTPIPGPLRIAGVPVLGDLFFRLAFGRWGLSAMWLGAVADRAAFPYRRHRAALRFPRGTSWTRKILLASLRDLPGLYTGIERIARALGILRSRYGTTCALVMQEGACFQCVELDRFFQSGGGNPLDGTAGDLDARIAIVRERRDAPLGPWHRQMMRLVAEILDETSPPSGGHPVEE